MFSSFLRATSVFSSFLLLLLLLPSRAVLKKIAGLKKPSREQQWGNLVLDNTLHRYTRAPERACVRENFESLFTESRESLNLAPNLQRLSGERNCTNAPRYTEWNTLNIVLTAKLSSCKIWELRLTVKETWHPWSNLKLLLSSELFPSSPAWLIKRHSLLFRFPSHQIHPGFSPTTKEKSDEREIVSNGRGAKLRFRPEGRAPVPRFERPRKRGWVGLLLFLLSFLQ